MSKLTPAQQAHGQNSVHTLTGPAAYAVVKYINFLAAYGTMQYTFTGMLSVFCSILQAPSVPMDS